MPCDCDDEENELVPLRFVGGRHKKGRDRGPYLTYETGKIYRKRASLATVPWFELVKGDVKEEDIIENPNEETPPPSEGLTRGFTGDPPTPEERLFSMNDEQLKNFYEKNSGKKVDGRWGRKKLEAECLELM